MGARARQLPRHYRRDQSGQHKILSRPRFRSQFSILLATRMLTDVCPIAIGLKIVAYNYQAFCQNGFRRLRPFLSTCIPEPHIRIDAIIRIGVPTDRSSSVGVKRAATLCKIQKHTPTHECHKFVCLQPVDSFIKTVPLIRKNVLKTALFAPLFARISV